MRAGDRFHGVGLVVPRSDQRREARPCRPVLWRLRLVSGRLAGGQRGGDSEQGTAKTGDLSRRESASVVRIWRSMLDQEPLQRRDVAGVEADMRGRAANELLEG